MQKKYRLFAACFLMLLAAYPVHAGNIDSVFYDDRFGTIDDTTGAFTQIGTLPISTAAGIAYSGGDLYVQSISGTLVGVDPLSGASSVIGSSGLQLTSAGFAGGTNGLFEFDYASNLYSIDPSTGAATLIGATGLGANNGGWDTSLADDGSTLYLTGGGGGSDDELYAVNTTTGVATNLGNTGVSGIAGSAIVDGNLELFQYHWSGAANSIYSAPLGSTDFIAIANLQAQVVDGGAVIEYASGPDEVSTAPEPLSFLLLGSGLIGLALLRRRRKPREIPTAAISKSSEVAQFPVNQR